jgi:hypothetical protein
MYDDTGMLEFLADGADALCPTASKNSADISVLTERISQSRYAETLLAELKKYDTELVYDMHVQTAEYDKGANKLRVNPSIDAVSQILSLAGQLRNFWQHRAGALIDPLNFYPDHSVLANRVQKTDISVCMIRVAWEMMLAGDKAAWAYIEKSSLSDLGRSFAREAQIDFRNLNNGMASAAVFESWFLSDRCQDVDKNLIQSMLSNYQGCLFNDEQTSSKVLADLIVAVGTQPFGKNYLAQYVSTIAQDALFTELRDRSNANFLWFIKFEHSFKQYEDELEQGLQHDGKTFGHETHHDHSKNNKFGDERIQNEEGQLITLPVYARSTAGTGQEDFRSTGRPADVITLDSWRDRRKQQE